MAPSPTGEFHIGSMRTLLYNWAFAKKSGGDFIIRIEDTDQERYVEGSVDRMVKVLKEYGFTWDEGPEVGGPFEPYVQSQRLSIYKKYALELVEKGSAYYCFCTEERLEKLRE
jgi:glutamyl-tRNA synthetase